MEKDGKKVALEEGRSGFLKRLVRHDSFPLVCVFVAFVLIVSIVNPRFVSGANLKNILLQVSVIGIITMGMMVVMISGGIDLSVGWMMAFLCCGGASLMMNTGLPVGVSIACIVLTSVLFQALMGAIISWLRLESFIVSLGFMSIYKSFAYLITDGSEIPLRGSLNFMSKFPLGISILVYAFAAIALIMFFVMNYTKYGKRIYALGCNAEAAFLSGIHTNLLRLSVYMINGLMIGISAVLLLTRLDTGTLTISSGQESDAIASCVVGGVALSGGKGKLFGVIVGILFLGCIKNSMTLMSVSSYISDMLKGLIILVSVVISNISVVKGTGRKRRRNA